MGVLFELVHRAQRDDPEAMKQILDLFRPKVKKSSRWLTGPDREDLEQELNLEILRAVRRFNTNATPGFHEYMESWHRKWQS